MTIDEAVRKFANDFNNVPTQLITEVYKNNPDGLLCLNSEDFMDDDFYSYWPCAWGTMFSPRDWTDREWIKNHVDEVEKCGFTVFECEYYEILLGLNSAGYDFFEAHWKPLYLSRRLSWHDEA
jgi:hypothetical protein